MSVAVEVEGLRKAYGSTVAVDQVSFEVAAGEVFGLVGPNGAGKTTAIECLEGLRRPDQGRLRVLGLDPTRGERELRRRIGVQLQESSLPDRIRVGEALDLFAAFYDARVEARPLLERLDLAEKERSFFAKLSGGQKQRLFVALALLHDPEVVFLDELTAGLDPHARRSIWELIEGIREQGKTVILTTHYMEEAERLCDRVAILNRGRIAALDSPASLIAGAGGRRTIVLELGSPFDPTLVRTLPGVAAIEAQDARLRIEGTGEDLLHRVLETVLGAGGRIRNVEARHTTLEDVYLAVTGPTDRSEEEASEPPASGAGEAP